MKINESSALIIVCGRMEWWVNGRLHRPDGPAVIWPGGTQEWWLDGRLHRPDGPAILYPDSGTEWWVNGQEITQEVEQWLIQQEITWPFTPEEQMEFLLTWL